MANSSLSLTSLDVATIESSLKTYMRSQSQFADYDFDGSNLSALIRILALNSHLNGFFLNMVHSEGFLDSAQTRGSVLSHAKELNYTPRSARSARGSVLVTFTGTETSYVIPKGKTFSAVIRNRGLVFSVPSTILTTSANSSFSFETDLYEGQYVKDSYVVNHSDETQRFILTNPTVDTRSLVVSVFENGSTTGDTYVLSTTLLDVDETDKVFFLQAAESGQYEIIFGDDVIGRRPADGSIVVLDYRVTVGPLGNGAKVFNRDFDIGEGVSNVRVTSVDASEGGADAESIESIRYYAPRHFQTQERAVTASDYEILLKTQFPEIRAVSAYGGEDATPPRYGKVMIALDISDVEGIPSSKKDEYYSFLKKKTSLTIEPIFIEPERTFLTVVSNLDFNINVSTITKEALEAIVSTAVADFAEEFLNDFDSILKYSRLVAAIDDSHTSIISNRTVVEVYKRLLPARGRRQSLSVDFGMPLYDGYPTAGRTFPSIDVRTVRSSNFTVSGATRFITDDGNGAIWLATNRGSSTLLLQKIGTVNYGTGLVNITVLSIDNYSGFFKVYAKPALLDISTKMDTILQLEDDDVSVTAYPVRG